MRSKELLAFYATKFRTIEINYTFRHLPTDQNIADWTAQTPADFLIGLKASQQITHMKQLREPATTLPLFFERARLLGPRLGPILFQTPRWVRRDEIPWRRLGFASIRRALRDYLRGGDQKITLR